MERRRTETPCCFPARSRGTWRANIVPDGVNPPRPTTEEHAHVSFASLPPKQGHESERSSPDVPYRGRGRRQYTYHGGPAERGSSDPSADRPLAHAWPRDGADPNAEAPSDDDVEILPDRFDSQGRPLDSRSMSHGPSPRFTTRHGEFERRPRRPGDWGVRGAWQVGGTDPEAVERMVRGMTDVIDGRRGWMGLLGDVLASGAGGLLGGRGPEGHGEIGDGDGGRGRRRRP